MLYQMLIMRSPSNICLKLSRTQCKWSTVEKKAYAIHFALQKLGYYLHGAQFVIQTDHKPLKYLLESPIQNKKKKIQLWALSMTGYSCTIEYIAGIINTCADLLSRKKGKRKVQGVPQSQTAALPRPQEEEETDKSKQAQTEQTYEKH